MTNLFISIHLISIKCKIYTFNFPPICIVSRMSKILITPYFTRLYSIFINMVCPITPFCPISRKITILRWYSSKKLPQIPSAGIQRLPLSMEVDVCSSFFLYSIMSILCKRWTIFFLFLKLFTMEKEFPKNIRLPFPRALTSLFDRYGVILPQSRTRALQDNPYRLL